MPRALMEAYHEYNGDPEDYAQDVEFGSLFRFFSDAALMGYLAHRVQEQIGCECESCKRKKRIK